MASQGLLLSAMRRAGTLMAVRRVAVIATTHQRMLSPLCCSTAFFSTQPLVSEKHESESFLTGTSSIYVEQLYENYLEDPNSVHESWRHYFDNLAQGVPYNAADYSKPTHVPPIKFRKNIAVAVSKRMDE
jgi:2-oxoglutarate dehydrogenase E1 component